MPSNVWGKGSIPGVEAARPWVQPRIKKKKQKPFFLTVKSGYYRKVNITFLKKI